MKRIFDYSIDVVYSLRKSPGSRAVLMNAKAQGTASTIKEARQKYNRLTLRAFFILAADSKIIQVHIARIYAGPRNSQDKKVETYTSHNED